MRNVLIISMVTLSCINYCAQDRHDSLLKYMNYYQSIFENTPPFSITDSSIVDLNKYFNYFNKKNIKKYRVYFYNYYLLNDSNYLVHYGFINKNSSSDCYILYDKNGMLNDNLMFQTSKPLHIEMGRTYFDDRKKELHCNSFDKVNLKELQKKKVYYDALVYCKNIVRKIYGVSNGKFELIKTINLSRFEGIKRE